MIYIYDLDENVKEVEGWGRGGWCLLRKGAYTSDSQALMS